MSKEKKHLKKVVPPFPLYTHFPSPTQRTVYRTWNSIRNHLYPVSPWLFIGGVGAAAAYNVKRPTNAILTLVPGNGLEKLGLKAVRVGVASLTVGYMPVFMSRLFLRLFYFSYKGFLFDNPKKPSLLTRFWALCRKVLDLVPVQLKSCRSLLPTLPLPSLNDTVNKYLEGVQHTLTKEEFEVVKEQAEQFLANEGPRLQLYARVLWLTTDNYVTGFWEKYAYHYSRDCVLINSSVAHADLVKFVFSLFQAGSRNYPAILPVRVARVVYIEVLSHLGIDRQEYAPLGNGLLCATHYDKMYAVVRVPGDEVDHLKNYGISRHVVLQLRGVLYKVDICDSRNRLFTVDELALIIEEVLERDERDDSVLARVPALTTDRRDSWAVNRRRFFLNDELNRETLELIESAVFFLVIEDDDYGWTEENPLGLDKHLKAMLTGNGANRWADKSLNYIISTKCRAGGTTEHSIADGSEFDHIMENHAYMERYVLPHPGPLNEQREMVTNPRAKASAHMKWANRLTLNVSKEMAEEVERCFRDYQPSIEDVDVAATFFREFGKGLIKKGNCSPDAFMQMAIQLANFKDQGRFVPTYEAASTRFYKNSRTETLRTVSAKSCAFVKAMLDSNTDKASRLRLLREACELHVEKNKECMVGKGIDRHLFVLFVLSKGSGLSSPFLDSVFSQQWLLSTSHIPVVTSQMDDDADPEAAWLGACFGAVAKTGYGICYRYQGNHSIIAHITSYHSAKNTDSRRFQKLLIESLREMVALFD